MTRLLVTGASGFIGRHVLAYLPGFSDIHVASRHPQPQVPAWRVTWHVADLRDACEAARIVAEVGPTHVLHLAWNTEHGAFWEAPDNERWADASIALFDAFVAHGGRRFVAAGSCAEYDWSSTAPCREDITPLVPHTRYGAAKLRTWRHIADARTAARTTAVWGRVFLLYGRGEHPNRLVPAVAKGLRAAQRVPVTAGTQVRDFLHVSDVARAFATLLTTTIEGAVNIGSGTPTTVRSVVELLGEIAGRPDLIDYGALPIRADDPPVLYADVAKLRSTGWRPLMSLRDGLASVMNESA